MTSLWGFSFFFLCVGGLNTQEENKQNPIGAPEFHGG